MPFRFAFLPAQFGATLIVIAFASGAYAQDLEPRSYANTPIGLNFLIAGYGYTEGGVATDPALPLQDTHVQLHGSVFAYVRSLDVGGKSGKFDVIASYACASGSAKVVGQARKRDVCGFGDPRFRFSVNLYGAPALSLQEFADYKQNLIIGASLQVSAPLGQYDSTKLLNLGTNRWFIKPELGISQAWGQLTLELDAGVAFFTENSDFLDGHTRAQDALYAVQGHLIYNFGRGVWGAVDSTYYTGGRTTLDGVEGNDRQASSRVGLTLALPVSRHNSIKLFASTGASTRIGSSFDTVGLVWQYRWGGGL